MTASSRPFSGRRRRLWACPAIVATTVVMAAACSSNGHTASAQPQSTTAVSYGVTLGGGYHGNSLHTVTSVNDRGVAGTGTASLPWDGDGHTTFLLGAVDASVADYATATLSARTESSSLLQGSSSSQLYPAALVSVNLARANPSFSAGGAIDALRLHGGWARSGNNPKTLHPQASRASEERLVASTASTDPLPCMNLDLPRT